MFEYVAFNDELTPNVYDATLKMIEQKFPDLLGKREFTDDYDERLYIFSKDGNNVITILYNIPCGFIGVQSEIDLSFIYFLSGD